MARYLARISANTPRVISVLALCRPSPHFSSKFEVDIMDEFTSQLMQRKIGKWDQKKRKYDAFLETPTPKLEDKQTNTVTEKVRPDNLGLMFQNLLDNEDTEGVVQLIKSCVKHNAAPPATAVINIASVCAHSGERDTLVQLQELCQRHHPQLLKENSQFRDFLAQAVWVRGDVSKALEMFEDVYRENAYLRRRIRLMLKYLIADLVTNGSEAALGNMISFSERIVKDFQDFFPLACVWQGCFLSEWFTDQRVALELLEKHNGLCKSVINRIPYVVFISLKCHRTEVVYRLLEILLKYRMKPQYSSVLGSLLDYQCKIYEVIRVFLMCAFS